MDRTEIIKKLENMDFVIGRIMADSFLDEATDYNMVVYDKLDEISDKITTIVDILERRCIPKRLEARVRYVDDLENDGEGFVFENKWSDEKEWGMDTLFNLIPQDDDPTHDLISYQALTKLRELQNMGIDVRFGK